MNINTIPDTFTFGELPSEMLLWDLKTYLQKSLANNWVKVKYAKIDGSSSGTVIDLTSMIGDGVESPQLVDAEHNGAYILFVDRSSNTKVTASFCKTASGAAYSDSATFSAGVLNGMWGFNSVIYASNLENNCKVKLTTNASTLHYLVIMWFTGTGKTWES